MSTGIHKWRGTFYENQGNLRFKAQRKTCCDEHESKDFTVRINTTERRKQNKWKKGKQEGKLGQILHFWHWELCGHQYRTQYYWANLCNYYANVTTIQILTLAIFLPLFAIWILILWLLAKRGFMTLSGNPQSIFL